jgi:hypothetical protein
MLTENINLEVNRIKQNISDSYSELSILGATIPEIKSADNLATCASTLQTSHMITQNGDNLVTNYGTNINHDGKNTIKSLALSQCPGYLNFLVADDGNNTVKFSLDDLKTWINTPTPAATTLHQYDRVDDKATVAGFWTDGNGQRYAVCVVDAAYRRNSQLWSSGGDTPLPNYSSSSEALAAGESGTYNTDTILNNYEARLYPAFNLARNACTVTVDIQTFTSCLPNASELQMIWNDRDILDACDPTLSSYPYNSLSTWNFRDSSNSACWSSNEYSAGNAWSLGSSGLLVDNIKRSYRCGILPIIEIPVDENGTVITN